MSIPILGQSSEINCVVCGGRLTPDHSHVYVDEFELKLLRAVAEMALKYQCIIPTDQGLMPAHPPIQGLEWFPVRLTHEGPHGDCTMRFPHHHCEVRNDDGTAGG